MRSDTPDARTIEALDAGGILSVITNDLDIEALPQVRVARLGWSFLTTTR